MATPSLYKQSIPVFVKYLTNMSAIVKKGQVFADEKGKTDEEILNYRLIPDQRGLPYQVQSCCNTAVWFADRVGKFEHVEVADDETTFEQLQTRLTKTIDYLKSVDAGAIDAGVGQPVIMTTKVAGDFIFESPHQYLLEFAMPNFHFHLSTAYCILRTLGTPLGAMDYLAGTLTKA
ncbi:hypothetical protein F4778DRAFT_784099 [Xylariomycetidae sp. FL2044]|nr:hypothetical protein F4778DRAFT_784099 [Xylariomycetidae sp. FL2044]